MSNEKKLSKPSLKSTLGSKVARLAIAPLFYVGAQNALKNAKFLAPKVTAAAKKAGITPPMSGEDMVKTNAYAQMGLSTALGLGVFPQLAALGLVGSLAPTTVVGHAFWDHEDEGEKQQQKLQFVKNLAVLGGLLFIATRDKK